MSSAKVIAIEAVGGELQRDGELLGDELQDRHVGAQRNAEIALQGLPRPGEVLHRQRIVEAVLLAQQLDHDRVPLLAGQDEDRVAGQQLLQDEDEDRDEDDRRDCDENPPGRVGEHQAHSPRCPGGTNPAGPSSPVRDCCRVTRRTSRRRA
jgi:hypothetical protein